MFCVQCEHTIRTPQGDAGCSFARGMCGKTSEVYDLQDMLVHLLQAVSTYAVAARKVGVIDADLGLNGGDLRAAERTFQLLYQVAGRAGRDGRPGRALIQTHNPEHPVMQALVSGDRDRFVEVELHDRAAAGMPRRS